MTRALPSAPARRPERRAPALAAGHGAFPDADGFARRARRHPLFAADRPIAVGRAPGRLDVLGGIADYSGSLVLALPTAAAALVAAQPADDGRVVAVSGSRRLELDVDELLSASFDELAALFAGNRRWGAYALGPAALLAREAGIEPRGCRLLVASSVPEGKGLGSSAAVEVAALAALAASFGARADPRRLALLAQRAEQLLARAPCGPMDQMTAACGVAGELLLLLCRPAEVVDSIPLPAPLTLWGIDSGVRHAVAGDRYRRARCAAFMGKRLVGCEDGYLAGLDPARVAAASLPARLLGADYLRRFEAVDDPVSRVEPGTAYPVRAATLFPPEEHARVARFAALAREPFSRERALELGALMLGSHRAYSRCGLGDARTDAIVEAVVAAGWERGLAGARIGGGGSGGTVAVLGRAEAEPAVREIAARLGAGLVRGSSPGLAGFGVRSLGPV